jgi:hypothetical protein
VCGPATTNNLLPNGSFEAGLVDWLFQVKPNTGAAGQLEQDQTNHADGSYSARIQVTGATPNAPWNVSIDNGNLSFVAGQAVHVSFSAMSTQSQRLTVALQQVNPPYTVFDQHDFTLTMGWATYSFDFTPTVNEPIGGIYFSLAYSVGILWLDSVSVTN